MLKIIGSQWCNILLRIVSALVLTPFLIRMLGATGYGAWVFLNAVVGYLSMLQGGMPASSLRHLSETLAAEDHEAFNKTLASSLSVFGFAGLAMLALAGVLIAVSCIAYDVPSEFALDGPLAFAIATLAVVVALIYSSLMTVMEAHGAYLARNLIEIGGTVLRTVLTVALILSWQGSLTLVALSVLIAEVAILVAVVAHIRRHYPFVRIGLGGRDRETMRSLLSFSMVGFLLAMGARIAYKTDALVIGIAMPMSAVSAYAVANTLALYLSRLVNGVAEPLMPRATRLRSRGADRELRELFLKWSKITMSIGLMIGLFLLILGPAFVSWWINPEFGSRLGHVLRILVASFILMLPTSAIGFRFLLGLARPMNMAMTYVFMGLLNLGISALLVRPYGLEGVAIGTALPNVLLAIVVVRLTCKEVGLGMPSYLRYVVVRPLLAAVPVGAVLLLLDRMLAVDTLVGLIIAGTLHLLVFAFVWVVFVYRNDEYFDLRARLRVLWRRRPA